MKIFDTKKTTQELVSLGMALHGDRGTMETRIRSVFSRQRSTRFASLTALALALVLVLACFTTACQPIVAEAAAEELPTVAANSPVMGQEGSLLPFDGFARGVLDGDRITVTDTKGAKHAFTWVDEGIRKTADGAQELSEPIPEGTYAAPGEVALRAAETAVTVFGDAIPDCVIHINMYTGNGLELVYYGIGFDSAPFELEHVYGYADAVTGTILCLDNDCWGRSTQKYSNEAINEKVRTWDWTDEKYAAISTSDKALATAMELVRTCFPTGKIIPKDQTVWDAGSHTDGEQIGWNGAYVAFVDAYIRMDKDPCYYVQVAVPLEEGAEPGISIFGCYPLGWEYCCNQIHDPAVLRQEQEDWAAIRNGTLSTDDGTPASTALPGDADKQLAVYAARAEALLGTIFTPMADEWKKGDDPAEYQKIFLVRFGAYLDDGYEDSDPLLDPAKAAALAKRGNVLRFESDGAFSYAVYLGDGQMIYADADTMKVCKSSVSDWMKDRPDCTCCILTWR